MMEDFNLTRKKRKTASEMSHSGVKNEHVGKSLVLNSEDGKRKKKNNQDRPRAAISKWKEDKENVPPCLRSKLHQNKSVIKIKDSSCRDYQQIGMNTILQYRTGSSQSAKPQNIVASDLCFKKYNNFLPFDLPVSHMGSEIIKDNGTLNTKLSTLNVKSSENAQETYSQQIEPVTKGHVDTKAENFGVIKNANDLYLSLDASERTSEISGMFVFKQMSFTIFKENQEQPQANLKLRDICKEGHKKFSLTDVSNVKKSILESEGLANFSEDNLTNFTDPRKHFSQSGREKNAFQNEACCSVNNLGQEINVSFVKIFSPSIKNFRKTVLRASEKKSIQNTKNRSVELNYAIPSQDNDGVNLSTTSVVNKKTVDLIPSIVPNNQFLYGISTSADTGDVPSAIGLECLLESCVSNQLTTGICSFKTEQEGFIDNGLHNDLIRESDSLLPDCIIIKKQYISDCNKLTLKSEFVSNTSAHGNLNCVIPCLQKEHLNSLSSQDDSKEKSNIDFSLSGVQHDVSTVILSEILASSNEENIEPILNREDYEKSTEDESSTLLQEGQDETSLMSDPNEERKTSYKESYPLEVKDLEDPGWDEYHALTTDQAHYDTVRKKWGSINPPNPNRNLTVQNFRRKRLREKENVVVTKPSDLNRKRKANSQLELFTEPAKKRRCIIPSTFLQEMELAENKKKYYFNLLLLRHNLRQELKQIYLNDSYGPSFSTMSTPACDAEFHMRTDWNEWSETDTPCDDLSQEIAQKKNNFIKESTNLADVYVHNKAMIKSQLEEVKAFDKFYLGLQKEEENPTLISEDEMQQFLLVNELLYSFSDIYHDQTDHV